MPCAVADALVTANTAAADGTAFAEAVDSTKLSEHALRHSRHAYWGRHFLLMLTLSSTRWS